MAWITDPHHQLQSFSFKDTEHKLILEAWEPVKKKKAVPYGCVLHEVIR